MLRDQIIGDVDHAFNRKLKTAFSQLIQLRRRAEFLFLAFLQFPQNPNILLHLSYTAL
jgi:hypothetical protein